jgi:hypothetical protein
MARQPLGGLGRLIFRGFTITLLDTPHSVRLLWKRDQFVAETLQHTTLTRQTSMPPVGFCFCLSGVFPLCSIFVLFLYPFVRHVPFYVPYYRPYNKHNTNIHALVGFEPTILVSERPKTHALDRAVTGIGQLKALNNVISNYAGDIHRSKNTKCGQTGNVLNTRI